MQKLKFKARELAFRAWDGQRMIYFGDFAIAQRVDIATDKLIPYIFCSTDNFEGKVNETDHKMMQYTGAEDSEGKRIYENDILKVEDKFRAKENQYVPVGFIDGAFRVGIDHEHLLSDYASGGHGIKITCAGNIYENPDLLPYEDED